MATQYPSNIDDLNNPSAGSSTNSPSHAAQHSNANDAIEAIETELGTNPKGSHTDVKTRLNAIESAATTSNQKLVISATAPSSPFLGQIWIDTSDPTNPILKIGLDE